MRNRRMFENKEFTKDWKTFFFVICCWTKLYISEGQMSLIFFADQLGSY